jgi:uncharacterized caspase-like protein
MTRLGIKTAFAVMLWAVLLARPAAADTRVALVVGESAYAHVPHLANTKNDADLVTGALESIGFQVTEVTDLDHAHLTAALEDLARRAPKADVALIYFAGHGVEVDGKNYLIPIDANLSTDSDVEFEGVPLDSVRDALAGARALKIVILDACRENPFPQGARRRGPGSGGLTRVAPESGDEVIAYAAAPGATADDGGSSDSPYATALVNNLRTPGKEIRMMFGQVRDDVSAATNGRQRPATYQDLGGTAFVLDPSTGERGPDSSAATQESHAIETEVWESVRGSGDPAELEDYLKRYPNGVYAQFATDRLAALRRSAAANQPPALPEPSQSPARGDIRQSPPATASSAAPDVNPQVSDEALLASIVRSSLGDGPTARLDAGWLDPIDLQDIARLLHLGFLSRELIYCLLIDNVRLTVVPAQGGAPPPVIMRNDPSNPQSFELFRYFIKMAMEHGLTTETYEVADAAGGDPSLDRATSQSRPAMRRFVELCYDTALASPSDIRDFPPDSICGAKPTIRVSGQTYGGSSYLILHDPTFPLHDQKLQLDVSTRSIYGLFHYLGEMVKSGQPMVLSPFQLPQETTLAEPLLDVTIDSPQPADGCFVATRYMGHSYCAPQRGPGADNTRSVFAIVRTLLDLRTPSGDRPVADRGPDGAR